MPEERIKKRALKDKSEGKAPSTQAGEFVREEIDHIRAGKHGARSAKQAIAIGLSKARRAGVDLPPPKVGTSERTRKAAARDSARGRQEPDHVPSARRSRAARQALQREPSAAATPRALSRQAHSAARAKTAAARSAAARKAAATKAGARRRSAGTPKARTRRS
jgi:hypothetical protein